MTLRWRSARKVAAFAGLVLVIAGGMTFAAAAPSQATGTVHAPITGSGSTWSANALQQWIRNVWANYQWKLTYSESGSTQGRNDFANGTADFGVSEIPYGIANSNEADSAPTRGFAYIPIVAGGTSFMYNLEIGGKRVTNLRLSGDTLAKIFTGAITVWNDPAIATDNPSLALPATPIVPVVRSDGSGTSAQFSTWMRQQEPALWDGYCATVGRSSVNGHCGITSYYPYASGSGFVAKSGANGVAGYVAQKAAVGSITFVEYSYALNSGFPVVKMLNKAGYYTEPTASNVAVALLQAQINNDSTSQNYLTQDLSLVYTDTDPRAYPLSSYSYMILPTKVESSFTENKGLTLGDFGAYFLCTGQQQAETLGYSPLPVNLVLGAQKQLQKVPGGDPNDTGFSIASCNNPTLDPSDPNGNALAKNATYPADCDKFGVAQCTTGTGGARNTITAASKGPSNAPTTNAASTTGGNGASGSGDGTSGTSGAGSGAATNGDAAAIADNGSVVVVAATPQTIPSAPLGVAPAAAMTGAGVGLLGFAALPPLLGKRHRRSLLPPPTRGSPS